MPGRGGGAPPADAPGVFGEPCLDPNQMAELVDGLLPAEALRQVEAHLDICDQCRREVADLVRARRTGGDQASLSAGRTLPATTVDSSPTRPAEAQPRSQQVGEASIIGRRVLGCYQVVRRIGEGGMGSVYLLQHDELPDTFAALKVMAAARRDTLVVRDRFRQEALAAAAVGTHRVARPLDVGEFDDGIPYIVMEYVAGHSLVEELRHGPLPVTTALRIAVRVAETMVMAHRKSIVHRDLKPANIMLLPEGEEEYAVKLLDFGIARPAGSIRLVHTSEQVIMGTPGYWSPEAVAGGNVDGRSDVFSLGVILFQMLTGRLPFVAHSVESAMLNVLVKTPAPAVAALRPPGLDPVPSEVESVVMQALEKDRDKRLDMDLFHEALARLLGLAVLGERGRFLPLGGAPSSPDLPRLAVNPASPDREVGPGPAATRWPWRRRLAAVLILLAVTLLGLLLFRWQLSPPPLPPRASGASTAAPPLRPPHVPLAGARPRPSPPLSPPGVAAPPSATPGGERGGSERPRQPASRPGHTAAGVRRRSHPTSVRPAAATSTARSPQKLRLMDEME